jgi:hypothetical protein
VTDQELRAMVREAIARQQQVIRREPDPAADFRASVSFARLPLASGGDGDGACLIEPSVRCNHCGYCLSYGH